MEENLAIKNAITYEKWQIFKVSCRLFGVKHFYDKVSEMEKIEECSFDEEKIELIEYIGAKIEEQKKIEGILDIYSENYYWIGDKSEIPNFMRSYDQNPRDILRQLHDTYQNCYYGRKEREELSQSCPEHTKNSGEINARFHHIDNRHRERSSEEFRNMNYTEFLKLTSMNYLEISEKYEDYLHLFKEVRRIASNLIKLKTYSDRSNIYDENTGLHKYLKKFAQESSKDSRKRYGSKIIKQFRKLKSSHLGNQVFEEISFYINSLLTKFVEVFGKIRNKIWTLKNI